MSLKDDNRPSWEELIVMEIGFGQSEIRDEMVLPGPAS
jgi:hypothetical protein